MPVVNLDGFNEINRYWIEDKKLEFIRKNMRGKSNVNCDKNEDIGVDLNRNYDFAFGYDEVGSNSNPCADDYRGPSPFSEPATR